MKINFQSLRIYGDRGTMVNDQIAWMDADGKTVQPRVEVEMSRGNASSLLALSTTLPDGRAFAWRNPFPEMEFTEDQVGLALHLETMRAAVQGKGDPLYSPHQALLDMEIISAIRLSGLREGKPIRFPVRPALEKAAWLAWPGNWGKVMTKAASRRGKKR